MTILRGFHPNRLDSRWRISAYERILPSPGPAAAQLVPPTDAHSGNIRTNDILREFQ